MLNIHPFTLDVGDKKIEADNKPVPVCDCLFRLLLSESEIHQLFVNYLLDETFWMLLNDLLSIAKEAELSGEIYLFLIGFSVL